ncbi:MAG TPA: aminotransferase class I/II-fold pyridoxal phosphate-dependent enzyme [Planctomycetota bacterium]|nr:aminotransferase class I/II-fold pyridoxal phosphate-dependent enzyme [Planctomycetota bacterium]
MNYQTLLAQRVAGLEASGIRKIFDLAATIKDAINLSIGQPDFDVPDPIKESCIAAIRSGFNRYPPSAGFPELRSLVKDHFQHLNGIRPECAIITSGTSGALTLALMALINPGDEALVPDPYFVSYKHLTAICGGKAVYFDTYPDFIVDAAKVEKLITPRTKAILAMSPANPTGVCLTHRQKCDLTDLARAKNIVLISDEIYEMFSYADGSAATRSLAAYYPEGTLAVGGLSKTLGMTGWRVGWATGPADLIEALIKLQQFTFVCAPSAAQRAALGAFNVDLSEKVRQYRGKRDFMLSGLRAAGYDVVEPGGAFYLFPRVPAKFKSGQEFVEEAVKRRLLLVPGNVFSTRDTHFRISYAASDSVLAQGLEVMREMTA